MQAGTTRAFQVPSHPTQPTLPQFQPGFSSTSDPYFNLMNQMNSFTLGQSNTTALLEQFLANQKQLASNQEEFHNTILSLGFRQL